MSPICYISLAALLVSTTSTAVHAVLPPASSEDLKANADERFMISVNSVQPIMAQPAGDCVIESMVTATVLATQGTEPLYQPGELIVFPTYYYDSESSSCQGFTGPASPPQLEAGWCGLAYLNQRDTGALELAAFGDSLMTFDGQCNFGGQGRQHGNADQRLNDYLPQPATAPPKKEEADERFMISVDSVASVQGQQGGCVTDSLVTATVVATQRREGEEAVYQPGDKIVFSTYYYNPESSACQGFTGPASPPQITADWCGLAYLNKSATEDGPLELAAYGDSLVSFDGQCNFEAHQPTNGGNTRRLRGAQ